jgi:hypothetical protein
MQPNEEGKGKINALNNIKKVIPLAQEVTQALVEDTRRSI